MILANTYPFPFMLDLPKYPQASVIDETALADYQAMHHWVFETALNYEIEPYLLFFPFDARSRWRMSPRSMSQYCTRQLLETYSELSGIFVDAGEERRRERNRVSCSAR